MLSPFCLASSDSFVLRNDKDIGQLVDPCNNPGRVHSGLNQNDDSEDEEIIVI